MAHFTSNRSIASHRSTLLVSAEPPEGLLWQHADRWLPVPAGRMGGWRDCVRRLPIRLPHNLTVSLFSPTRPSIRSQSTIHHRFTHTMASPSVAAQSDWFAMVTPRAHPAALWSARLDSARDLLVASRQRVDERIEEEALHK